MLERHRRENLRADRINGLVERPIPLAEDMLPLQANDLAHATGREPQQPDCRNCRRLFGTRPSLLLAAASTPADQRPVGRRILACSNEPPQATSFQPPLLGSHINTVAADSHAMVATSPPVLQYIDARTLRSDLAAKSWNFAVPEEHIT
jgi:hypothetical protein